LVDDESHHAGVAVFSWIGYEGEAAGHLAIDDVVLGAAADVRALTSEHVEVVAMKRDVRIGLHAVSLVGRECGERSERVRQEFDSVLGEAPLSYSDVPKFEFTTQVIQEGLRLYPPFWMIDRMAVADDRVGDLAIPRGSTVIVYVYGAHHAPRYWPDPENFDTQRFTKANEKLRTPFTFLPFGGGPRGCIGGNYAMLQILMILNDLLRKYDFQLAPGQMIEARPMVILRPKHGIRMTFTNTVAPAPCVA
jgi:Cytochrome P450